MFRPLRPLYVTESVNRVKCELAGSKSVPIEVLIELAFDESEAVRRKVADNPRTPIDLLICMTPDKASP